jgi:hypothetical protein
MKQLGQKTISQVNGYFVSEGIVQSKGRLVNTPYLVRLHLAFAAFDANTGGDPVTALPVFCESQRLFQVFTV